jgi:hypothetical protein
MIGKFFVEMRSRPLGLKLWNALKSFLDRGYIVEISSYDDSRVIYPKIKYVAFNRIFILIPSVPYFTEIKSLRMFDINNKSIKSYNNTQVNKLMICESLSEPLNEVNFGNIMNHTYYSSQTYFIMFIHELIHGIRHFKGIVCDDMEEESTIYGISGKTLILEESEITENTIRKEWLKPPRISHDSNDVYIYGVQHTYNNSKEFSKESFFTL